MLVFHLVSTFCQVSASRQVSTPRHNYVNISSYINISSSVNISARVNILSRISIPSCVDILTYVNMKSYEKNHSMYQLFLYVSTPQYTKIFRLMPTSPHMLRCSLRYCRMDFLYEHVTCTALKVVFAQKLNLLLGKCLVLWMLLYTHLYYQILFLDRVIADKH